MIALPIIFVPFILFLNSFAIGKLYKRLCPYLKTYLTTLLGLISYVGGITLIFEVLSLFTIQFNIVLYVLLTYQIILLLVYILNWRKLFLTYMINWKYLGIVLLLIIISLLVYIITRNYSGNGGWIFSKSEEFYQYYITEKDFINNKPDNIQIFQFNTNIWSNSNFSFFFIFLSVISYIFHIDQEHIKFFHTYLTILIYCFSIATISLYSFFIFSQYPIGYKYFFSIVTIFALSLLSFWLEKYFWIVLVSYILIVVHKSKQNQISTTTSIIFINFIVLFGIMLDPNFIFAAILINGVQIFLSYRIKKENATDYNFLSFFSTLLFTANIIDNSYASFVMIVILLSIFAFYIFYKSSNVAKKINFKIDSFLYKHIIWIFIVVVVATLITAIILFFTDNSYKIFTDPWLIIQEPPRPVENNITSWTWYWIINILFWISNAIFFIYCIIRNNYLRIKPFNKFTKIPELDGSILGIALFWNPLSLNTYNLILSKNVLSLSVNYQTFFIAIFIPLLVIINMNINYQKRIKFKIASYSTCLVIASSIIITSINIGVIN